MNALISNRLRQPNSTFEKFAFRLTIVAALVASAILIWFVRAAARDPRGNGQLTGTFLCLLYSPIWGLLAAVSACAGHQLGSIWKYMGWVPMLTGSLIIAYALFVK